MNDTLQPIDPTKAVELYLQTRADELADTTFRSQKARLSRFAEWCEDNGIENLNDLTGRHLQEYRLFLRDHYTRRDGGKGVSPLTIRTRLSTVRVFLRFGVSIDAVEQSFPEKMVLPQVDKEERYREEIIESDHANDTLEQLRQNRYGSKEHALFELLWTTGCRLGSIHSLDVSDVDHEKKRIEVRHRPEQGTSLKNQQSGERILAVDDTLLGTLATFVDLNRIPATDDYGRKPLFTTDHGRPDKSTLRNWAYKAQLPCYHSNECPHGREIADCDLRLTYNRPECPSTTMPHNHPSLVKRETG